MAERRRSVPKTSDRLGRMLAIVPYLVQHPGSALDDVATAFGVAPGQLRRDATARDLDFGELGHAERSLVRGTKYT